MCKVLKHDFLTLQPRPEAGGAMGRQAVQGGLEHDSKARRTAAHTAGQNKSRHWQPENLKKPIHLHKTEASLPREKNVVIRSKIVEFPKIGGTVF
jgi:hypothetical protein